MTKTTRKRQEQRALRERVYRFLYRAANGPVALRSEARAIIREGRLPCPR